MRRSVRALPIIGLCFLACAHAPSTQASSTPTVMPPGKVSLPASPEPLCGYRLGSGPVRFVYLHGGPGFHSADFARTVVPLLARDSEVVAFDQRGAGCSPKATGADAYALAAQEADVVSVIQDAGAPVVLVGHSYGGLLAAHVALDHPDLIAGLVLLDAPLDLDHALDVVLDRCAQAASPEKAAALRAVKSRPMSERIQALGKNAADCVPQQLVPPGHHPTMEEIDQADQAAGYVVDGGGEMNRATWKQWPSPLKFGAEPFAGAPFPRLAIWGAQDPYYPDPAQHSLPTVVIPNVGHMSYDENPAAVAEALLSFAHSPAVEARLGSTQSAAPASASNGR